MPTPLTASSAPLSSVVPAIASIEFSVVEDRVWDLRFLRVSGGGRRQSESWRSGTPTPGAGSRWSRAIPTTRYSAGRALARDRAGGPGRRYEIIEEALNGRTTDLADPTLPQLSGAGLDGSAYLPAAVASHLPLDLVVIMLGTNDLKTAFDRSPEEVAVGIRKLIDLVKAQDRAAWTEYPAPKVLVVAPPPMRGTERFPAQIYRGRGREVAATCGASTRRPHLPPVSGFSTRAASRRQTAWTGFT